MSAQTIILLMLVGLAAGILSGLVGIGGGIIIVPCLVLVLGLTQKEAQGTSLAILLLPVGIFAVMNYYKQGHIHISTALIVSLAFLAGGYFGSKLALSMDEEKLKKIFAVTLMLVAIKMLFFDKHKGAPKAAAAVVSASSLLTKNE